ncbi:MAG: hypothetical protein ACOC0N_11210 [Chroococcales cyanobacterium]
MCYNIKIIEKKDLDFLTVAFEENSPVERVREFFQPSTERGDRLNQKVEKTTEVMDIANDQFGSTALERGLFQLPSESERGKQSSYCSW